MLTLNARGFFKNDGQQGIILAIYNGGLFGLFQANSGACFTIHADEFHAEPDSNPTLNGTALAWARDNYRTAREHAAAHPKPIPQGGHTVALVERPHSRTGGRS